MNIKLLKTATKMKATRQLLSLCLVIGMTITSYAVPFSPPDTKGVPATYTNYQPYLYNTAGSGSGDKCLSRHFISSSSFCIANAGMFGRQALTS